MLVGCGFTGRGTASDAPGGEVGDLVIAGDAAPAFCPGDPHLRLCFSFDEPLPATLPNEGAARVDAIVANVGHTSSVRSGAAMLTAASSIFVPMHPEISGILATEVWFRLDEEPANQGRAGLWDSNVIPPNISLFILRIDPVYQLRCGIGSQLETWDAPIVAGAWHYAACICEGGALAMHLDDTNLGARAGACDTGGALVADGLTIGANNNGGPTNINDQLIGTIDGVRYWDMPITPASF